MFRQQTDPWSLPGIKQLYLEQKHQQMLCHVDKCAFLSPLWEKLISACSLPFSFVHLCLFLSHPSVPSLLLRSRDIIQVSQNVATRLLPLGNSTDNQENAFQHDEVS